MNTLLIVLGTTAGVVTVLLLIAFLTPKELNIEKTILINKSVAEVFDYIKYVKNHDNFSVWAMMDPDMKKEYRGTDGQVGFVYAWDSSKDKNVGAGEQEIKSIVPGKSIEFELRFKRPFEDVSKALMIVEASSGSQTRVQWGFYSTMKFPMVLMKPVFKKMMGGALEKGLGNLKAVLEK